MVRIYTTPDCRHCLTVKNFLKSKNIPYQEFNVAEDERARDEMIQKSHQLSVPVIDINGTVIVDFNRSEIEKALNLE
jgi:glutaredoxin-like YruB-family protein